MNTFLPGFKSPEGRSEAALWFVFRGNDLLVEDGEAPAPIPSLHGIQELGLDPLREHYLGHLDGRHCYVAEVDGGVAPPPGMAFRGLRPLLLHLEEGLYWVAGRALQILEWDRNHRFCGRCATPLLAKEDERAKACPRCGLIHFPRISPAVLVLVYREGQLLRPGRSGRRQAWRSPAFAISGASPGPFPTT
jgi:NAD+ diphosphatase